MAGTLNTQVMLSDVQINEHIESFMDSLKSGEYRQIVMENDEVDDQLGFGNESLEDYIARINNPNNYNYMLNRFRTPESGE